MAARMDQSKTPIFDRMAADLSGCRPEYRDAVLCPMCLREFGRSEIKRLTKDHVLSKSLGGNAVTLTCKPCNNACGHKVQLHLTTLLKMNEGFRGNGEFRGMFTVFGETVPVGVQVRPGTGIGLVARGGSPKSLGAILEGMKSQARSKWSMQVKIPYNPGKASVAIARAAYLAAFYRFGYRYVLSEPVNLLRAEIVSAMDVHSARLCILTGTSKLYSAPSGNEPESIIVPVALENGYRFLLVMMKFQRNRDYWLFCALPHADQDVQTLYADLAHAVQMLGGYDVTMAGDESGDITVQFVKRNQLPASE